jgi:hypothetical protein
MTSCLSLAVDQYVIGVAWPPVRKRLSHNWFPAMTS